jgi:hypothetical protein
MSEAQSEPLLETSPTSSDAAGAPSSTIFQKEWWTRDFNFWKGLLIGIILSGIVIGILAALKVGVFSENSTGSSSSSNMMNNATTYYPRPTLPNVQTTFRSR